MKQKHLPESAGEAPAIQAGGEENLRRMIEHYAGLATKGMKALPPAGKEKPPMALIEPRAEYEAKPV